MSYSFKKVLSEFGFSVNPAHLKVIFVLLCFSFYIQPIPPDYVYFAHTYELVLTQNFVVLNLLSSSSLDFLTAF